MKALLTAGLVAIAASLSTPDAHAGKKDDLLAECKAKYGPETELLYEFRIIRKDRWECFTPADYYESERLKMQCIAAGGAVRYKYRDYTVYGSCVAKRTPRAPVFPPRSETPDIPIQQIEPYRAPETLNCRHYQIGDRWYTKCY